MGVDQTLGSFGDLLFGSALAVYLLAMILHAVEHGLLRRTDAPAAERVPAAVGAGADSGTDSGTDGPVTDDAPPRRSAAERFGRCGVALTVLGAALHVAMLGVRGVAAGRAPWGNMYEFTAAICLAAVVAWLVVLHRRPELRRLGAFVLLPVIVLMFLAGTVLYTETAPVVPALRSYWLAIHVTAAVIASGILLLAGVASCLYLARSAYERRVADSGTASPWLAWTARLPESAVLDRVAYRATALAFPIWTFAVLTGAIWAEAAWGRYWGWDPKETTAFIAWVVYAGYLHARSTAGWRGVPATWINILGFAVMIFNLFFVNLVVTGLHSYAGLG